MRNKRRIALLALSSICAASVGSTEDRESLRIGNDVFVAGDEAAFSGELSGDALLAGGQVALSGSVGGDAVLAGGRIDAGGSIGEDLYAAGGELAITGRIGGSARVTGGEIEIGEGASIGDGLSIAGGRIELNGHVNRYAQIAGGEVRINGRVDGDVNVSSGELVVGPDTVIEGRLTYRGRDAARVSSSAQVRGGVVNLPHRRGDGRIFERMFGFFAFVWLAGWTFVGILLIALLPRASRTVTDTVRSRPGAAALLGAGLLCGIPVLIVLATITLVGIPLALVLALLYFVLLPLGYLASVATLGDALLPRLRGAKPVTTAGRVGVFVLALIVVWLLTRIPVLGGLIALALILVGMGGLTLALVRRAPASPAPAT